MLALIDSIARALLHTSYEEFAKILSKLLNFVCIFTTIIIYMQYELNFPATKMSGIVKVTKAQKNTDDINDYY